MGSTCPLQIAIFHEDQSVYWSEGPNVYYGWIRCVCGLHLWIVPTHVSRSGDPFAEILFDVLNEPLTIRHERCHLYPHWSADIPAPFPHERYLEIRPVIPGDWLLV